MAIGPMEARVRARLLIDPKDIDWGPPRNRSEDWPDDPDTRRFTEWLRSLIPAAEWSQRRLEHFYALYGAAMGVAREESPDLPNPFHAGEDRGGWYLFQAESWIDHIADYEPSQGSRIIPLFQTLGREFDLLLTVEGVEARARRILRDETRSPDGAIFELLAALAYRRAGWRVSFVDERRDAPTPDMVIENAEQVWAVECKRMSQARYTVLERDHFWRLWQPARELIADRGVSYFFDLDFKAEVHDVAPDYLARLVEMMPTAGAALLIDDEWAVGRVSQIDMGPIRREIRDRPVHQPSQRLFELLTGEYRPAYAYAGAMMTHPWPVNPRYIDDLPFASVARWRCSNDRAIDAKARHFKRQMATANRQLSGWGPSALHLGFEAMEGYAVEAARHPRLLEMVRNFDPGETWLWWIYIHHFNFETPPDAAWAVEETVEWFGIDSVEAPFRPGAKFLDLPEEEDALHPWDRRDD